MFKTLALVAGLSIAASGVAMAQTTVIVTCPDGYAMANGSCQPIATPGVVGGAVGAAGAIAGGAVGTAGAIAGGTINAVTGAPPPPPYR
jgi:hypothetical protein